MGGMGQFLPLLPGFAILMVGLGMGIQNSSIAFLLFLVFIVGPAIYKGSDIIDQPFLRYDAIAGRQFVNDDKGNKKFFGATYLIGGMSDVKENSAVIELYKILGHFTITPFVSSHAKVDRDRFTVVGTNFRIKDIHQFYDDGNGELFGFDFPTAHVAAMQMKEDPVETITDERGTMAVVYLTSEAVIDDQLDQTLEKRVQLTN